MTIEHRAGYSKAVQQTDAARSFENCTLQTLDRWIQTSDGPRRMNSGAFMETVKSWNNIPVVFGRVHPNCMAFSADPEAELKRVGGRIAGSVQDPRVALEGHPTLDATMKLWDREALQLYQAGRLSLSTGFMGGITPEGEWKADIEPNHVLIFAEDDYNRPVDLGTSINKDDGPNPSTFQQFLNEIRAIFTRNSTSDPDPVSLAESEETEPEPETPESENDIMTETINPTETPAVGAPAPVADQVLQTPPVVPAPIVTRVTEEPAAAEVQTADYAAVMARMEGMNQKIEALNAAVQEKDAALQTLTAEMKAKDEALAAIETEKKEGAFKEAISTMKPGLIATEAQITALRESYNKDQVGFIKTVLAGQPDVSGTTTKDGVTHQPAESLNNETAEKTEKKSGLTLGKCDTINKTWRT